MKSDTFLWQYHADNGDNGEKPPLFFVKTTILPVLLEPLHVTKSQGPNVCGTKTSPPGRAKRWPERVEPPGASSDLKMQILLFKKWEFTRKWGYKTDTSATWMANGDFTGQKWGYSQWKQGFTGSCEDVRKCLVLLGFLYLYDPPIHQVGGGQNFRPSDRLVKLSCS